MAHCVHCDACCRSSCSSCFSSSSLFITGHRKRPLISICVTSDEQVSRLIKSTHESEECEQWTNCTVKILLSTWWRGERNKTKRPWDTQANTLWEVALFAGGKNKSTHYKTSEQSKAVIFFSDTNTCLIHTQTRFASLSLCFFFSHSLIWFDFQATHSRQVHGDSSRIHKFLLGPVIYCDRSACASE